MSGMIFGVGTSGAGVTSGGGNLFIGVGVAGTWCVGTGGAGGTVVSVGTTHCSAQHTLVLLTDWILL